MLTLHYSKGSSAIAAHILLEETGTPYTIVECPIAEGAHQSEAYLSLNPKGRIPALETPEGIVTENPAILWYIGETATGHNLLPSSTFERARVQDLNAYICATAHIAFAHKQRGHRWSDDPAVIEGMKSKVAENLRECARIVEKHYLAGPWVMGTSYTICDPYLFLLPRWLKASGVELDDHPKLSEHHDRMLSRPATQKVLAIHGV